MLGDQAGCEDCRRASVFCSRGKWLVDEHMQTGRSVRGDCGDLGDRLQTTQRVWWEEASSVDLGGWKLGCGWAIEMVKQ